MDDGGRSARLVDLDALAGLLVAALEPLELAGLVGFVQVPEVLVERLPLAGLLGLAGCSRGRGGGWGVGGLRLRPDALGAAVEGVLARFAARHSRHLAA